MKNKSVFSLIILLVILAVVCIVLTLGFALVAGSIETTIFDFRNINFANFIPVLLIGGFITCVVVGIGVLFVSKSMFGKVKDFLSNKDGGNKQ